MSLPAKVCPVVSRNTAQGVQVLGFRHPSGDLQFVKGGLKPGEAPLAAALRELHEESGLRLPLRFWSTAQIQGPWHFFHATGDGLPERWSHQTLDDHGHRFDFFWHPLDTALGPDWDTRFHLAFAVIRQHLGQGIPRPGITS